MPGQRLEALVRRLRREMPAPAGSSDADLLARFAQFRDEAAFELLVWRHGAMVLAVCRRILGQAEDAEDAFQAVFLVLARKARSVSRGAALPAWLHRVAVRIAARVAKSRRPVATLVHEPPGRGEVDRVLQAETLGALDDAVNSLPERFRRAVVLCYLEGLSASEAARQLGCPTGTVESRLAAARRKLRDRLTRRGVTLPAGILAIAGNASLAPEAAARTARASAAFAQGDAVANETSVRLASGVLLMWQTRKWVGVGIIASALTLGAGLGWAKWLEQPQPQPQPETAAALPTAPEPQAKEEPRTPVVGDAWPLARQIPPSGLLVGISPDGNTLFVRSDSKNVYGLDLTGKRKRAAFLFRSPNTIHDVAVSPDGKYFATAEGIEGVKLRDGTTGEVLEALWPSGKLPVLHVAFSPDGSRLVALGTRTDDPFRQLGKFAGKSGEVFPGGEYPMFGGPAGLAEKMRNVKVTVRAQVSVWDVATRKELGHPTETTVVPRTVESGVSGPVYDLDRSGRFVLKKEHLLTERKLPEHDLPNGAMTYPGQQGGFRFTVIDALTGKAARPVEVKEPSLNLISQPLSPDGKSLVAIDTTTRDQITLLDAASGKERARLSRLLRPIKAVTFSPDSRFVAAASGRDQSGANAQLAAPSEVVIWDATTGKELARLMDKESSRDYVALRFSPDGSFLVAQEDRDGGLFIWGRPPMPQPEKIDPPTKTKGAPVPTAVPDRFQTLFQSLAAEGVNEQRRIEGVFLAALGRLPTDVESRTLAAQFARQADKSAALRDLLNTLVDTDEFKAHADALRKLVK